MKVPFFEIRRYADERDALNRAARQVIDSGRYIGGEEVERFEEECARFLRVKYAVGVSSGTDALIASLMALEIRFGDRVAVPAFTFAATASAVARVGAIPVFCDIHPDDFTIDASTAEGRIDAIIPVHLFGAVAESEFGPSVIEDAAQAFGSFEGIGVHTSTICHSFFPTKNLGGFGDGGLVTTNDSDIADRVRRIRNHGSGSDKYCHHMIGGNFRLDALQAALLRVALRSIPRALEWRRMNAARYHDRLKDVHAIRLPPMANAPNQFVIRVRPTVARYNDRDWLREHLRLNGIGTEIYYPTPLHLQPCFGYRNHNPGDFPVAERAAKEVLALPIFPGLREDEIDYVCEQIVSFFR